MLTVLMLKLRPLLHIGPGTALALAPITDDTAIMHVLALEGMCALNIEDTGPLTEDTIGE